MGKEVLSREDKAKIFEAVVEKEVRKYLEDSRLGQLREPTIILVDPYTVNMDDLILCRDLMDELRGVPIVRLRHQSAGFISEGLSPIQIIQGNSLNKGYMKKLISLTKVEFAKKDNKKLVVGGDER